MAKRSSKKAGQACVVYPCRNGENMGIVELFILAAGLSMDSFAVSICKGLSLKEIGIKQMCIAGAWFGGFQAVMPLTGYFFGSLFAGRIEQYDHWIAFVLLAFLGGKMIREARGGEVQLDNSLAAKPMFLLAVATSIDALAVGVTFAFLDMAVLPAVLLVGTATFVFSAAGMKIGSMFGTRHHAKAELSGGIVLLMIGLKILLEGIS